MRHTYATVWALCVAGVLLCSGVAGQTEPSTPSQLTAPGPGVPPAEPPSSPSSSYPPGHKHLSPVDANDIGLFIVISVALFIAAGAGVGGGKIDLSYF